MKDKQRKEKATAERTLASRVSQAEQDVEDSWKLKSDRMVSQAEARWKKKFDEVQDELLGEKARCRELVAKVSDVHMWLGSTKLIWIY